MPILQTELDDMDQSTRDAFTLLEAELAKVTTAITALENAPAIDAGSVVEQAKFYSLLFSKVSAKSSAESDVMYIALTAALVGL